MTYCRHKQYANECDECAKIRASLDEMPEASYDAVQRPITGNHVSLQEVGDSPDTRVSDFIWNDAPKTPQDIVNDMYRGIIGLGVHPNKANSMLAMLLHGTPAEGMKPND